MTDRAAVVCCKCGFIEGDLKLLFSDSGELRLEHIYFWEDNMFLSLSQLIINYCTSTSVY